MSDLIHGITENGLRHASGPVLANNIPSVTYIVLFRYVRHSGITKVRSRHELRLYLNAVHDLCELELESDLEQPLVLADRVSNARLNSVSEKNPKQQLRNQIGCEV